MEEIKQLIKQYPFITLLKYGGDEYIGIIQNSDEQITTIYDFGSLRTKDQKIKFLSLGEQWWWESNRMIPINVFLKTDWSEFKFSIKTFLKITCDLNFKIPGFFAFCEVFSEIFHGLFL